MTAAIVLIAALSGRALACSARRAGYVPLVADMFCDQDTQAAAQFCTRAGSLRRGFRAARLLPALQRLAAGSTPIGVVTGTGFEDRPALLDAIARHHTLLGNDGRTVGRSKDPWGFASMCRQLGVPHPPVSATAQPGWLVKQAGGAGGLHIRHGVKRGGLRPGRYAQQQRAGRPVSALFLADGQTGLVLGFSAQWADPLPRRPYRYGGAVRPARLPPAFRLAMTDAIARLIPALGLRGLNSADFLLREDGFDLLEVNPRPGATFDIFPDSEGQLFSQHIAACQGRLPAPPAAEPAGAAAAAILYRPRPVVIPAGFVWPDWSSDREMPGSAIPAEAPICTVRAEAPDAESACALLRERMDEIAALISPALVLAS